MASWTKKTTSRFPTTTSEKPGLGQHWTFQHDGDPKHTAKAVKKWLADKNINVLRWPSRSPDLNPIEHRWRELKIRAIAGRSSNLTDWSKVPVETCQKPVHSYRKRLIAVIASKRLFVDYWEGRSELWTCHIRLRDACVVSNQRKTSWLNKNNFESKFASNLEKIWAELQITWSHHAQGMLMCGIPVTKHTYGTSFFYIVTCILSESLDVVSMLRSMMSSQCDLWWSYRKAGGPMDLSNFDKGPGRYGETAGPGRCFPVVTTCLKVVQARTTDGPATETLEKSRCFYFSRNCTGYI